MKTKEIEKLIDDLYFECIAHEELDEAFQIGMDIYRDRIVMCFGWNSSGVGKKRGMELVEVLLVAHGGSHNDTICTVERKTKRLTLF